MSVSLSLTAQAQEKIRVVTTIPDLAEAARTIGGNRVEVESLLKGTEDAHFLDALPTFIRTVANADVVCVIGLELEVGWMPKVLSKSAKAKVQPGGSGYCETGKAVSAIGKPTGPIDRSQGDVHPSGNPHFNLNPKALAQSASVIADTLIKARPEFSAEFTAGLKKFEAQMNALHTNVQKKLKTAQEKAGAQAAGIEYHKEFSYFFAAYGLNLLGSIEEKPGIPPSAAHLADVAQRAKAAQVKLALSPFYGPEKHLKKFSEISGIPYRKLPTMVQVMDAKLDSIEKVQNYIADTIIQNL